MKHLLCISAGLALFAAGCATPGTGGAVADKAPSNPLQLGVLTPNKDAVTSLPAAAAPIVADGKLDEPAWKQAAAMGDFLQGRSQRPLVDTRVLATYDKENLYLAVVCAEPATDKLVANAVGPDGKVWSDDGVEIYLDPGSRKTRAYYCFMVNSRNVTYDRMFMEKWNGTWASGAAVVPGKAWMVELAIPFKTLEMTPEPGRKLGLMVARNRRAGGSGEVFYLVPCDNEAKKTAVYPVVELK
jgi:hypothetical protein